MKFGIPQIIMISLMGFNVLNALARHGEIKKEEKWNFFTTTIATTINVVILIYGGFFK